MTYEHPIIVGVDTETFDGPPITIQLYSEDAPAFNRIIWVNEKNATQRFLAALSRNCKRGEHYVLFGHYLPFDLVSLFWPQYHELVRSRDRTFKFDYGAWTIAGVYGTPTFADLTDDQGRHVTIVDGYSWFRCSLAKAAELVCPNLPKLPRMKDLGQRKFTAKDTLFCEYAMRDAEVAYHVGKAIDAMHRDYELSQSVSIADMASRIFRKHHIEDPISRTGPAIAQAALLSYHGGKNNMLEDAAPAWHTPVSSYDISSAYPHAMTLLPSFTNPKAFGSLMVFSPRAKSVPRFGVYQVSGKVADCAWPALFDHSFKPLRGKFENIWLHGYEVNEALRTGELKPTKLCGFIYDEDRDGIAKTAFQSFVETFYQLKQTATDPVRRFLYKTLLNSISGKFIQTKEIAIEERGEIRVIRQAAGLFHPFIASTITAHTRATIHRMEHHAQALHTATDGIFAPGGQDVVFDFAPTSGLGSISLEARGELCLVRNKCYLLQSKEPGGYKSFCRRGWYNNKVAMHGFHGSPKQFEELIFANRRKYTVERPYRLREAVKQGHVPNRWVKRDFVLKVPPMTRLFNYAKG